MEVYGKIFTSRCCAHLSTDKIKSVTSNQSLLSQYEKTIPRFLYTGKMWAETFSQSSICRLWLPARCIASTSQSSRQKSHIITILLLYLIHIATIIAILSAYCKNLWLFSPHITPILCPYFAHMGPLLPPSAYYFAKTSNPISDERLLLPKSIINRL